MMVDTERRKDGPVMALNDAMCFFCNKVEREGAIVKSANGTSVKVCLACYERYWREGMA